MADNNARMPRVSNGVSSVAKEGAADSARQPIAKKRPDAPASEARRAPSAQQGAKAARPRPQGRPAPARAKARPAPAANTANGVNTASQATRVASNPQATAPRRSAVAPRTQAVAASSGQPTSPKREGLGNTSALAKRPAGANNTALARRPSSTGQIQVRPGRHFPAKAGTAPKRSRVVNSPYDEASMDGIDSAPQRQESPHTNTAIELARKISSFSFPSIVLPSNERKIPSDETTSDAFDTRSPFTKAKDFCIDKIRTPQAAAIGVLLVIYLIGSVFWSFRYLPGTRVNGLDASWATPGGLASRLEAEIPTYTASANGQGVDLSVSATDIDLAFDADTWENSARAYLPSFGWPIQLITKRDFRIAEGVSFDDKKLEGMVTAAVQSANKNAVEPKNATFEFDEQKDLYIAVKEEKGTAVNLSHTCETVKTGVSSLQSTIPITLEDLSFPTLTITSSDFASALEQANQLAHMSIALTYNGEDVYDIDSELIRSWLTINKSNTVTADLDKVTEWARGPFSQQIDTLGTQRTYTRAGDGKQVTVAGGTYGWSVDGKKLANLIRTRIAAHSLDPIEIPMLSTAKVLVLNGQDWGSRYIDVDLSEQYVRMFDENSDVVIEAPCVTGNLSRGQSTVEGVYTIEYKESPAVLVGLDYDGDGVADYETPVNFWMPFYGGYGLHDAYWRSYFGSDAFTYDGSHGCVNLPYYAAEIIYSVAEAGDVVVVHW
jgi:lipoprotein-anchoring transpeptidase ErfK/SrfK